MSRKENARAIRHAAAQLAYSRDHPIHETNGEETKLVGVDKNTPSYLTTFTKGLPHNPQTGLLYNPSDYDIFRTAVSSGNADDIKAIPLGPPPGKATDPSFSSAMANNPRVPLRAWESLGAGLEYDLEGPDAQAVTMPPAPKINSAELAFEMTELYWMSLLRDVPFSEYSNGNNLIENAVRSLNKQPWAINGGNLPRSDPASARHRSGFTAGTVFRSPLPGVLEGPYLSQFMIAGTPELGDGGTGPEDGFISYGSVRIDQRVRVAVPGLDFVTTWGAWLDIQHGADVRGREKYVNGSENERFRFITCARDIMTYVHHDGLYESYLNACFILLGLGMPFDPKLPYLEDDKIDKQTGFAMFGAPHVLTLVTEVATRALKAVWFQKYQNHRRARPEILAARIEVIKRGYANEAFEPAKGFADTVDDDVLERVYQSNKKLNASCIDQGSPRANDMDILPGNKSEGTYLLPLGFPEGSPMHPSYGSGHATVAGACVTVLKAFFDSTAELPFALEPSADGSKLVDVQVNSPLTVGGELNKLTSNISVARNWAGTHYYSDFLEASRMGEEIAIGILQEQKLTYGEKFSMTVPKFDGSVISI